jgi:hypothetical protein
MPSSRDALGGPPEEPLVHSPDRNSAACASKRHCASQHAEPQVASQRPRGSQFQAATGPLSRPSATVAACRAFSRSLGRRRSAHRPDLVTSTYAFPDGSEACSPCSFPLRVASGDPTPDGWSLQRSRSPRRWYRLQRDSRPCLNAVRRLRSFCPLAAQRANRLKRQREAMRHCRLSMPSDDVPNASARPS